MKDEWGNGRKASVHYSPPPLNPGADLGFQKGVLTAEADERYFEGVSPCQVAMRRQPTLALSGSLALEVDH